MDTNSSFFGSDSSSVVPRFQPSEIVLETTIGMGEFGIVLKVGSIVLANDETDSKEQVLRQELAKSCVCHESIDTFRSSDSNYCPSPPRRGSASMELSPRDTPHAMLLVIKQIRKDLYPKKRIEAAKDLAREAKLLARLQQLYDGGTNHPNIISIRGIVSSPGTPEFGILLDRLHLTLTELSSDWKKRQSLIVEMLSKRRRKRTSTLLSAAKSIPNQVVGTLFGVSQTVGEFWNGTNGDASTTATFMDEAQADATPTRTTKRASPEALLLLGERVLALLDVSEGMGYLHHHKILYRDLKTENVARTIPPKTSTAPNGFLQDFDQQRLQIFDFGLAKECKLVDRLQNAVPSEFYETYKMTGMTGTMRIMAPEVIQCKAYGLSADVYSFGICMWEVFTGTKCNFLSAAEICDTKQTVRPKLPIEFDPSTDEGSVGMPKELQQLMQVCWHEDPTRRPSFVEISKILFSCLAQVYKQSLGPQQEEQEQDDAEQEQLQKSNTNSSFLSAGIQKAKSGMAPLKNSCAGVGDLWKKIPISPNRKQKQWQRYDGLDTGSTSSSDLLSDSARFWSRLEALRASGLLDD